jgi:acetyl esterase/lipase
VDARRELARSIAILARRPTAGVSNRDLRIPNGPARDIPARLYIPAGVAAGSGLLVYYHGGGFVLGDIATHAPVCHYLCARAQVRVLSVEYRLAPEHPFPAAFEDAMAAFDYAASHAEALGADPARVAVGGDSAGANLAASVSIHTARGVKPRFTLLFYACGSALLAGSGPRARGGRPTMPLRCSASRRAGPGVSSGRSRKWRRSVTNIARDPTTSSHLLVGAQESPTTVGTGTIDRGAIDPPRPHSRYPHQMARLARWGRLTFVHPIE